VAPRGSGAHRFRTTETVPALWGRAAALKNDESSVLTQALEMKDAGCGRPVQLRESPQDRFGHAIYHFYTAIPLHKNRF
jgi:hypothetical protein